MPKPDPTPDDADQPDDQNHERGKRGFSEIAKAYNEGFEQGGILEAVRRLRQKLDELYPPKSEPKE